MPFDTEIAAYPVTDRAAARAEGRALRRATGRRALAQLTVTDRDPVAHLRDQHTVRLPQLVGLRLQRMLADPFAFYRGTAGLMAMDHAASPHSGILVASCGDAHLSNFGFFASPERRLVFDLNDFDEAAVAPWEWDVKRLLASAVIGGRHAGYDEDAVQRVCLSAFGSYASTLRSLAELSASERYFMHLSTRFARRQLSAGGRRALRTAIDAAEKRTGARAVRRTTERGEDGHLRFIDRPPTMQRIALEDIAPPATTTRSMAGMTTASLFDEYRATVDIDLDLVLAQYEVRDLALRVVGVGSVGTRCFLLLLEGADGDALVLQVKEAGASVLNQYGGIPQTDALSHGVEAGGQGYRVVGLQKVLQAASDPFLGYLRGAGRDYYVRQFHDMKGSIELEGLAFDAFADYVIACAVVLGRAHAQSPTAAQVVGYIGRPDTAGQALVDWSAAYADQALRDFEVCQRGFAGEYDPAPPA